MRDPHDLLITLLVGITLVNIAASALATQVATLLLGPRGIGIAIPVMVFLIVVFGEVLPMTLAVGMPQRFGLLVARPVLALGGSSRPSAACWEPSPHPSPGRRTAGA